MPKIGTFTAEISTSQSNQSVEYTVMYTSKDGFYIALPSSQGEAFTLLADDTKSKFKARYLSRINNYAVFGQTEGEVKDYFIGLEKELISSVEQSRQVIIVCFRSENSNGENTPDKLKERGFVLNITYCTEKKFPGADPQYYIYTTHKGWRGAKDSISKESVSISRYRDKNTIIDDTPENRAALLRIYNALGDLHNQLDRITSQPEKLLEFINTNQRLLQ